MAATDMWGSSPASLPLKSGVSISQGQRVTLDGDGLLAVAGNSELGLGVALYPATYGTGTASKHAAIALFNAGGIFSTTAAGAISSGDKVELAASGKVAVLDQGTAVGVAISDTSADGQTVQVIFY